jgi:hypothetical protein
VRQPLQHDARLRAAASVIYESCYPGEEWTPVSFEDAERYQTIHYRQAVKAAQRVRPVLIDQAEQLPLT